MNDLSLTPAKQMAVLTNGHFDRLVEDDAMQGLFDAWERTGNSFLWAVAHVIIDAENGYAQAMRSMRQEGDFLPASHENREVQGPVEGQV